MSSKVWITAQSELIPFDKMTDKHVANAVSWCDIRLKALNEQVVFDAPLATRQTWRQEHDRVSDLRRDLLAEQVRRKVEAEKAAQVKAAAKTQGVWVTITADSDGVLNGTKVLAGQPSRWYIAKGRSLVLSA